MGFHCPKDFQDLRNCVCVTIFVIRVVTLELKSHAPVIALALTSIQRKQIQTMIYIYIYNITPLLKCVFCTLTSIKVQPILNLVSCIDVFDSTH